MQVISVKLVKRSIKALNTMALAIDNVSKPDRLSPNGNSLLEINFDESVNVLAPQVVY